METVSKTARKEIVEAVSRLCEPLSAFLHFQPRMAFVVDLLDPVPKPTVFESIPSASDICNWNPVLELLGTVRNSVSEVF
jgi:hypothetical protein